MPKLKSGKGPKKPIADPSGKKTSQPNQFQKPPPLNPFIERNGKMMILAAIIIFVASVVTRYVFNHSNDVVKISAVFALIGSAALVVVITEHLVSKVGAISLVIAQILIFVIFYSNTVVFENLIEFIRTLKGGK